MTTKPNGGPAFPQHIAADASGDIYTSDQFEDGAGMTLRDYFAAAALKGMLASDTAVAAVAERTLHSETPEQASARIAYKFADAMIAAREE